MTPCGPTERTSPKPLSEHLVDHVLPRISVLPLDILLSIMPFMAKHDQFNLIQIRRTIYTHGLGSFLHTCHVQDYSGTLASFCRFVLQDPARPLLIRVLKLEDLNLDCRDLQGLVSWEKERRTLIASTLIPLLERPPSGCRRIEELHISDTEYLAQNESIFTSISLLRSLKVMTFDNVHDDAAKLLRCIRAPVMHVEISSQCLKILLSTVDAIPLLVTGFRDTLCKLSLLDTRISFPTNTNGINSFLHVHTLQVYSSQCGDCSLQAIAVMFPNLVNLTWNILPFIMFGKTVEDMTNYRQESQKRNSHGWKLDVFECCPQWVYLLAFKGPVRLWKL